MKRGKRILVQTVLVKGDEFNVIQVHANVNTLVITQNTIRVNVVLVVKVSFMHNGCIFLCNEARNDAWKTLDFVL